MSTVEGILAVRGTTGQPAIEGFVVADNERAQPFVWTRPAETVLTAALKQDRTPEREHLGVRRQASKATRVRLTAVRALLPGPRRRSPPPRLAHFLPVGSTVSSNLTFPFVGVDDHSRVDEVDRALALRSEQ